MTRAGCILIAIIFVIESIFIIPLLWTIPSFLAISKINKGAASDSDKLLVAILGIVFGLVLGIIGGIFILFDMGNNQNNNSQ